MLSPHTPPGTKIVCINNDLFLFRLPGLTYLEPDTWIEEGKVYTLKEILPSNVTKGRFVALIEEIDRGIQTGSVDAGQPLGFDISRFRKAELPKCLTDLLVTKKIDEPVD